LASNVNSAKPIVVNLNEDEFSSEGHRVHSTKVKQRTHHH